MKKLRLITFVCFPLVFSAHASAEEFSFGAGLGTLYSGLGVNVASRSSTDLKYLSAGCVSYSDNGGATCGVGGGWIKTDLFDSENTQHGFGAYIGVVGRDRVAFKDDEAVYGAGVGYHYFFNGIEQPGTNIGLSFVAGDTDSGVDSALWVQLGYQF
ncbi:hypothetical protein [Alteromonas sp. KUL49]|uniref:hypothetical protein n=1 Tax=Alteromonas sp. KUL49 TaxID=2480798 RepID=UPI00102F2436|nr:hypothetical protein [Alteromonas sp. KUL49]TAP41290.1 hypothetical protein EYS00_03605 [Alteromonas sp. KUL49]GEA10348.1 hypothetical protein KUL49_07230 [Alteromonas sp. KUL49]